MKRFMRLAALLGLIGLTLGSCALAAGGPGAVSLRVVSGSAGAGRATVGPLPSSLAIAAWTVSGTGPAAETFGPTDFYSPEIDIAGLAAGDWNFTVTGVSAGEAAVASGTATVAVDASSLASATVRLMPIFSGNGSLAFDLSYPYGTLQVGSATGQLAPTLGTAGSAIDLFFIIGEGTITLSNVGQMQTLPAGNYLLTLSFTSGNAVVAPIGPEPVLIYGGMESVFALTLGDADIWRPSNPTNLTVAYVNSDAFCTLSWLPSGQAEAGETYEILVDDGVGGYLAVSPATLTAADAGGYQVLVSDIQALGLGGMAYAFYVQATTPGGIPSFLPSQSPAVVPESPSGLASNFEDYDLEGDASDTVLTWSEVAGASEYRVYFDADGDLSSGTVLLLANNDFDGSAADARYVIEDQAYGTVTGYYYVSAVVNGVESFWRFVAGLDYPGA
jgi:hypothetical protein